MSTGTTGGVVDDIKEAVGDEPVGWAARVGLTARGVVYLLLGALAVSVARGGSSDVDQRGVLSEILERPFGGLLVGLLALGFACYAAWRLYEAATGVHGDRDRTWPRVQSFFRGVLYAVLTFTAVSVLFGSQASQGTQQRALAADLMQDSWGRWLVGIVGVVVIGVAVAMIYEGVKQKFMRRFPAGPLSPGARTTVRRLGTVGTISRGLVFVIVGGLLVVGAWTHDAQMAGGIDAAVTTLQQQPYGSALLLFIAAGLIAFAIFGLAEARYRKV